MKTFLAALLCLLALSSVPSAQAAPETPDLDPCDGGQLGADLAVGRLCLSYYWPGCNVWIEWTAIPSQDTCLYRTDGMAAGASADLSPWPGGSTPDVQCMDVYSQTQVPGTNLWIVRRDSCSAQLYECPEGYSPPAPPCREASLLEASSTSLAAGCYMVYTRNDVGTLSVVRRTSCSPPEVYQCPHEGAPIDQCESVLKGGPSASAVGLPAVSTPPVYCMPYQRELEAGPVTVIQGGCGNDVQVCGTSVPREREVDASCVQATMAAAAEPECLQMYRETDLGLVRIVSRDSCHTEHYVCDHEKADILATRSLDTGRCDTGLTTT